MPMSQASLAVNVEGPVTSTRPWARCQTEWIYGHQWIAVDVGAGIDSTFKADRIFTDEPPKNWIVVPRPVAAEARAVHPAPA